MSPVKSPEELGPRDFGEKDKIVVKKDEAKELLPGWTTEVKVRKMRSATKIDRYYTDPATGYVFRSLKDVQRYLKTGEVGRLAKKPKGNSLLDKDNEDNKLHMSGKQSSSFVSETKSVGNLVESTSMEDRTCVSENASDTCKKIVEASDANAISSPVSEISMHKRPPEDGSEGYKTRSRSGERRKSELPRRASKRLAGINIDAPLWSPPEPKTRQATQVAGIITDASLLSLPEPKTRQATKLNGMETDSSSPSLPEPKTRQATRLNGMGTDSSSPSLPEPKTRQATRLAGIKIDVSPPSMPEPKTRQAIRLTGAKVDASASSPPEPKTRQATGQAGIKVDASVQSSPEPKASQATRQAEIRVDASVQSSPEPKTRQARQLAGLEIVALPTSLPEPKTRQARRLAGVEIDFSPPSLSEPKTRQARRLAGLKIDASRSSVPEPKTRQATRVTGMEIGASPPSMAEHKTHQATQLTGSEVDASLPERKTYPATQLTGMEMDASPPSLPECKTRQSTRPAGNRVDASPPEPRITRQATARRVREAESRTAFDLAALKENDQKLKTEKSTFREMQVEFVGEIPDKHDGNADEPNYRKENPVIFPPVSHDTVNKLEFKADEEQEKQELRIISPPAIPSIPKEHVKEIKLGPTVLPPVSYHTAAQAQPTVVSLHEKQELPGIDPPVSNPVLQGSYGGDTKPESSMSFSMNDLWTDPCIEFAVKTLTGAIPFGDLNKVNNFPPSPLEVPLEELWTDPCIEFAVKTLTGAIPVGEDPCVQDYLQHQSSSSSDPRAAHSFSLPDVGRNFCQTEVLSKHYETKQQDSAVPTLGNGSLQMAGNNIVVPQGSNGQCSRPRLFQ